MSKMQSQKNEEKRQRRRGVLKWLLLPIGFMLSFASGFGAFMQFTNWRASIPPRTPKYAVLVDPSLCTQCLKCVDACAEQHGRQNPGLYYTDVKIVRQGMEQAMPLPLLCRHCVNPPCEKSCVSHAITKLPDGPVIHDRSKCIGCTYCVQNCPFDSIHYDAKQNVVFKCDMCYTRVADGFKPACVEICPPEARIFGTYEEMVAQGETRAKEIGGSLLYPGETTTLYVINNEKLSLLNGLGIFKPQYPTVSRVVGDLARYMRLTLIPVAIGSAYCFLEWRKNRIGELVKAPKRGGNES